MKRYRTTSFDLDSRAGLLSMEIKDEWEESVKDQHYKNQEHLRRLLKSEFGESGFEQKERNIIDMGSAFPSIIFYHNKFLEQIRNSFIMWAYYPALTGVTTLTERILNHLVFSLKESYKATPEYKEVYNKDSFSDWDKLMRILSSWKALLPEAVKEIKKLQTLRHQYAAHFNPETDNRDRELALEAIKSFQEFVRIQFGSFGKQPWFIEGTKGAFFIKKEYENDPFVRTIYLPNCMLVGPDHEFVRSIVGTLVLKDKDYPNKDISDEEFKKLFNKEI